MSVLKDVTYEGRTHSLSTFNDDGVEVQVPLSPIGLLNSNRQHVYLDTLTFDLVSVDQFGNETFRAPFKHAPNDTEALVAACRADVNFGVRLCDEEAAKDWISVGTTLAAYAKAQGLA